MNRRPPGSFCNAVLLAWIACGLAVAGCHVFDNGPTFQEPGPVDAGCDGPQCDSGLCGAYCDLMEAYCPQVFVTPRECLDACAQYPADSGTDSLQCRLTAVGNAQTSPESCIDAAPSGGTTCVPGRPADTGGDVVLEPDADDGGTDVDCGEFCNFAETCSVELFPSCAEYCSALQAPTLTCVLDEQDCGSFLHCLDTPCDRYCAAARDRCGLDDGASCRRSCTDEDAATRRCLSELVEDADFCNYVEKGPDNPCLATTYQCDAGACESLESCGVLGALGLGQQDCEALCEDTGCAGSVRACTPDGETCSPVEVTLCENYCAVYGVLCGSAMFSVANCLAACDVDQDAQLECLLEQLNSDAANCQELTLVSETCGGTQQTTCMGVCDNLRSCGITRNMQRCESACRQLSPTDASCLATSSCVDLSACPALCHFDAQPDCAAPQTCEYLSEDGLGLCIPENLSDPPDAPCMLSATAVCPTGQVCGEILCDSDADCGTGGCDVDLGRCSEIGVCTEACLHWDPQACSLTNHRCDFVRGRNIGACRPRPPGNEVPVGDDCATPFAVCQDDALCTATISSPDLKCRQLCRADADCGGASCDSMSGVLGLGICGL